MLKARVAVLLAAIAQCSGIELTKANWDKEVAGKSVFVKFQAPWWGHCKRMKPDWDKLMAEFKGSKTALVADVDCTTGGKDLCSEQGVRGYPTIKYGDPSDLQDYKGGRTFKDMQKFAQENLGPSCSPANLDLCDAEKKSQIEEFMKLSDADLKAKITEKTEAMDKFETDFKKFVDGLQKSYTEANDKKEADLKELKDSGLGLMKAVQAHQAKAAKSEL